ncbi:hypothetical protein Tco_0502429 [Tanacetum coccineum]
MSGYAWNPSTKLIEVEDDVWEALKKDKPDVYELKTKQVNCYDEMYALWKKDRATSAYTQTAKEKKNRLNNDQQAETIDEIDHLYENNEINLDNIGTRKDIHVTSPTPQSDAKLPTISKTKKRKIGTKKRKADEEDPYQNMIMNSLDNIVHALDRNSKTYEITYNVPKKYKYKKIKSSKVLLMLRMTSSSSSSSSSLHTCTPA